MNLGDNLETYFDVSDIQFYVGLALSSLGHDDLAMKMIEYETHASYKIGNNSVSNSDSLALLSASRDRIANAITDMAVQEKLNHDYAAIKWFFTEPILKVSTSGVHKRTECVSAASIIGISNLDKVYSFVMKQLTTYKPYEILLPYIDSTLFDKPFRTALSIAIRKRYASGESMLSKLDAYDFAILKEDFRKIYKHGLTTSSEPFRAITGTPNDALCGSPVKLWYAANPTAKLYSVVFGSGQEMETSDGSVSRLNLKDINEETSYNEIDFIDICTKIYRASDLLFSHTGNLVYDIYSRHFDKMSENNLAKLKDNCAMKYSGITFETVALTASSFNNSTHQTKVSERMRYADYLDTRFRYAVFRHDIASIRKNLLEITRSVKPDDGCRLFAVDDHTVNFNTTQSQRLEILMSGYKAMYILIDYIDANEKRTGISAREFPVTIFRDPAYLKRFKTFDEYLIGHKIIQELLCEISTASDSSRRLEKYNGLYNNEAVGSILASQNSIQYSRGFAALGEKSLGFLYAVTHRKSNQSPSQKAAEMMFSISREDDFPWPDSYCDIPHLVPKDINKKKYTEMGIFELLVTLNSLGRTGGMLLQKLQQCSTEEDKRLFLEEYCTPTTYTSAISFFYVLNLVLEKENCPIVDDDGYFCFSIDAMQQGINNGINIAKKIYDADVNKAVARSIADIGHDPLNKSSEFLMQYENPDETKHRESSDALLQNYKSTFLYRIMGFIFYYDILFGTVYDLSNASIVDEQFIHTELYTYSVIKKYLDTLYDAIYEITDDSLFYCKCSDNARKNALASNAFSYAIDFIDRQSVMQIPSKVRSVSDLDCLYTNDLLVYMDRGFTSDDPAEIKAATARNEKRRKLMLKAFNKMLGAFSKQISSLNTLSSCFASLLASVSKETSGESLGLLKTLDQLNCEILSDSYIYSEDFTKASSIMETHITTYNEYGFAMQNGILLCRDLGYLKKYYHRLGAVCTVNSDMSMKQHSAFSNDDYEFIINM